MDLGFDVVVTITGIVLVFLILRNLGGLQTLGTYTPVLIVLAFRETQLGFGIVLYANAALQGAVMGMQNALTVLRDTKEVREDSGLVTPFAERQRLVGKPQWDALEQRYTGGTRAPQ